MATSTPPPSNSSPSPSSNGASWPSLWGQRLSWLISALSGTLESEAAHRQKMKDYKQRMKELEQENSKLDAMISQARNENERLAVLESKIDSSFSKYGINLPLTQIPEQP
jgi:hypothetical protein